MNRKRNTFSNTVFNNFNSFSHNFSFKFKILSLFSALFWSEMIELIFFLIQHLRTIHFPIQLHNKSHCWFLFKHTRKTTSWKCIRRTRYLLWLFYLSLSCWREEKRKTCYVPFSPFHLFPWNIQFYVISNWQFSEKAVVMDDECIMLHFNFFFWNCDSTLKTEYRMDILII